MPPYPIYSIILSL